MLKSVGLYLCKMSLLIFQVMIIGTAVSLLSH